MLTNRSNDDTGMSYNRHILWHLVDYLQRDAAAEGVLSTPPKDFDNFWNNLDTIMETPGAAPAGPRTDSR